MIRSSALSFITPIQESLELLSKQWQLPTEITELHLGLRDDVADHEINIDDIIFHIPKLLKLNLYVLWDCLWPDCHNCCVRQDRIPLTKDDIKILSKKLGYTSKIDFLKNETLVSNWSHKEPFGGMDTMRTQIALKRNKDEIEDIDEGKKISCRFLGDKGCMIHLDKPGVCSVYPFASYIEYDTTVSNRNGKPIIHALYQLTGDCPGYYLGKSLDDMIPILNEYSKKIYEYNISFYRTKREGYCVTSSID